MKITHVAVTHLSKITIAAGRFVPPRDDVNEIYGIIEKAIGAGAGLVLVNLDIKKISSIGLGVIVTIAHKCSKAGVKVAFYTEHKWLREVLASGSPLEYFYYSESDALDYLVPGWK